MKKSELRQIIREEVRNVIKSQSANMTKRSITENKIEMNRFGKSMYDSKAISIHGNPDTHFYKAFGTDIVIPPYPKRGDITFQGKKIGFVDNFSGFVITDLEWIKNNLDALNKIVAKTGFWYT